MPNDLAAHGDPALLYAEFARALRPTARNDGFDSDLRGRPDAYKAREAYLEAVRAHNTRLRTMMLGMGYDYALVNTHEFLGPALAAFVSRRNAQIKRH